METQQANERLTSFKIRCPQCRIYPACLCAGCDAEEMRYLETLVRRSRPFHQGEQIFRQGDPLQYVYVILAGSVKNLLTSQDGSEQILGFRFPGDVIGFDGIAEKRHCSSVIALERTLLCEYPHKQFEELCFRIPHFGRRVLHAASSQLVWEHELLLLLGQRDVEARVAAFLADLSRRLKMRGYSATDFNLSMSRSEIANYLGVAAETVSRIFSRFVRQGVIGVQRKFVCIRDLDQLKHIASRCASGGSLHGGEKYDIRRAGEGRASMPENSRSQFL